MRFGLFRRSTRAGEPDRDAVERVKAWVLAGAALAPGTALSVSEIVCTDPSCPGVETVVLVMEPGRRTRACKVSKPLDETTEADWRAAVRRVPPDAREAVDA